MKKKMVKLDYKKLFPEPWCPLFGHLPFSKDDNKTVAECINIIEKARNFWGLGFVPFADNPYPEISKANIQGGFYEIDFDKDYLKTIRYLYYEAIDIYIESLLRRGLKRIPKPEFIQREFNVRAHRRCDLETWEIYAISSIRFAMKALELFYYNKPEDDKDLEENIWIAAFFLSEAEKLNIEPYANRFLHHQEVRGETLKKHNIKKSIKGWDQLERILPNIIRQRRNKNNSEIFRELQKINYEDYDCPELNDYKNEWKPRTFNDKIKAIKETLQ